LALALNVDQRETAEGVLDDDPSEPTMGEKLASLNLLDENKSTSEKEQESLVSLKPPSADSVHVLLKQALNADDRALLLDCLYTQDEKVIFFLLCTELFLYLNAKLTTFSVSYM
jgi:U3 small nucleolar RNA-associated protein 5